jgi:hypothetical protein
VAEAAGRRKKLRCEKYGSFTQITEFTRSVTKAMPQVMNPAFLRLF